MNLPEKSRIFDCREGREQQQRVTCDSVSSDGSQIAIFLLFVRREGYRIRAPWEVSMPSRSILSFPLFAPVVSATRGTRQPTSSGCARFVHGNESCRPPFHSSSALSC